MLKHSLPRLCPFVALGALACAGGSDPTPSPSPTEPTYSVTATVFYDENDNGRLDASAERVRVPGVEVVIGNASAKSAPATGQALVSGIVEGAASVSVRTESLPYYYQASPVAAIQVPATTEVHLPLTLSIGRNYPNLYLGYGDSITRGEGSSDGMGYATKLQSLLGVHLGYAEVKTWGRPGDTSLESAEVDTVRRTLDWFDPAYTLILLGTNDWHDSRKCQDKPASQCYTIDALRSIVEQVKVWNGNSLPVLATIIPVNPDRAPAARNAWYDDMNVLIRALAAEQHVLLADLNAEFRAQSNLASLFDDDVHPNDAGYQVMARAWFKAITSSRSGAASSAPGFDFVTHP